MEERKTKRVGLRVTPEFLQLMTEGANAEGVTLSTYIVRMATFGHKVREQTVASRQSADWRR